MMEILSGFEISKTSREQSSRVLDLAPKRLDPYDRSGAIRLCARRAIERGGIWYLWLVDGGKVTVGTRIPDGYRYCWYVSACVEGNQVRLDVLDYSD